ncbi:unnamed protein product [Xylocopa violacea]|uniref:Uncharacterized protein n=1 Tax=Xylocopa violacea TaxID=135666 RepID=A0ABP1NZS3_XYLVO
MAVSVMWIRNNMLFSNDNYERQLMEAELKAERSTRKLSIPDWYSNKRSNQPKLINITPLGYRPPSWKKSPSSRNTTLSSTISNPSDTYSATDQRSSQATNEVVTTTATETTEFDGTSQEQKLPETRRKTSPSKSSTPKYEEYNTFPRMSPSRKIQNINLVLSPGPKIEVSKDPKTDTIANDCKQKICITRKQSSVGDRRNDGNLPKNNATPPKITDNFRPSEMVSTPFRTPNARAPFRIRAASTPRFSPANIFSSTVIEETPIAKRCPSRNIFEDSSTSKSQLGSFARKFGNTTRPRKMSPSLKEKTYIFENSSRAENSYQSLEDASTKASTPNGLLERNIRSVDSVSFEKDDPWPKSFSLVRDIVKKLEVAENSLRASERESVNGSTNSPRTPATRSSNRIQDRSIDVQKKRTKRIPECKKTQASLLQERKTSSEFQSPCTRFILSKRKSTDLEKIVKSTQPGREKSLVQRIIKSLTQGDNKSALPRRNQRGDVDRSFVKQLVNALENSALSRVENSAPRSPTTEEYSSSDSELKSCVTSASAKDTESGSDSGQRSCSPRRSDVQRLHRGRLASRRISGVEQETSQEDDSVFWIPVSRCKLPRTSSLLSTVSKFSTNYQSPCISTINSESEVENVQNTGWGATYRMNNPVFRNLFRIDKTVVIDSGYSDRSALSSGSLRAGYWSEDTQYESGSDE